MENGENINNIKESLEEESNTNEESFEERVNKIINFLNIKWPDGINCPICQNNILNYTDKAFQFEEYKPINEDESSVLPVIVLICQECGHVIPISYIFVERFLDKNNNLEGEEK